MASEDIFEKDLSEEVLIELDEEFVNGQQLLEDVNDFQENGETEDVITQENAESAKTTEITEKNKTNSSLDQESKLFQLPLTRIRNLMKLDPDVSIASHEAVFAVARCTELFIESLARESYTFTVQAKKKTIQKRDVDLAISAVDSLMFLDGAMNF